MTELLPVASPRDARRWIVRRVVARRARAVGTSALLVGAAAAGLAAPALLGAVVDVVSRHGHSSSIDRLAVLLLVVSVAEAVLSSVARVSLAVIGEDLLAELRRGVLTRALDLDIETVEQAGTGDLVGRCTTDVSMLTGVMQDVVPWVTSAAIVTVLTLGALAIEAPPLALTALAGLPVSYAFTRRYLRRAPAVYARERTAMADLVGGMVETTEGARTLRAYRAGPDQRRRVRAAASTWLGSIGAGIRVRMQFFPGLALGQGVSMAATLLVGALLARGGSLSTGQVTACVLYVARLHDPLSLLLEVLDQLQSAEASLCRLVGVASIPPMDEPPPTPSLPSPPIGVTARGLSFAYASGGPEVVRAVDVDIAPGERTVIVGASGAGKTTLAGIIAGLLHPTRGSVSLGPSTLDSLCQADRRRLVALLTQEPHVFAGTVGWNVTVGVAGASVGDSDGDSAADPAAALAAVGATWVDALPQGIDTVVGPGGHRLTPAQAQQLALARLVAADPAIVVLDEATADLSSSAAGAAERALAAALADRTVIAVAHRLDSAVAADQLLVMEDGEIVERGPHAELVQREGRYAALWSAWVSSRV